MGAVNIHEESKRFALEIIKLYSFLNKEKNEYILAKQLLRSGTSIGANVRESQYARIGVKSLSNDQLSYYMETLPARFAAFDDQHKGEYLALNAGIVAMNFVLALTDQGLASNMILGFDKSVTNDILNIDHRFQPELLITVGYSDETLEPSYRLPVDDLIERR